jgi:hypothetical protein
MVGLDVCGKSRPHRDSIPGPSSPYAVAIPTTLPGPQIIIEQTVILLVRTRFSPSNVTVTVTVTVIVTVTVTLITVMKISFIRNF